MGSNIISISIADFQCKFTALQIYECNRERERERKTGTKTQILIVCSKNSKATLYSLYSFNSIWSFAFRNVHVSQQRSVFFLLGALRFAAFVYIIIFIDSRVAFQSFLLFCMKIGSRYLLIVHFAMFISSHSFTIYY